VKLPAKSKSIYDSRSDLLSSLFGAHGQILQLILMFTIPVVLYDEKASLFEKFWKPARNTWLIMYSRLTEDRYLAVAAKFETTEPTHP